MVQVSYSVGTAQKGSMKAVSGSGMASMSRGLDALPAPDGGAVKAEALVKDLLGQFADGHAEVLPGAEGVDKLDVHHLGPAVSWPFQLRSWVCSFSS